jgi:ATP-dependent RNA helicase DHX29
MLERPKDFEDITHLVFDEVHERTIDGDFLLIVIRRLMHERPDLKLILMSATVDSLRLSKYLDNAPVLNIPGRTFPVEVKYLEDAVELTNYRIEDGQLPADNDSDDDDKSADESNAGNEGPNLKEYSKRTRETLSAFNEYHLDYRLITSLVVKIATTPGLDEYSKAILIFMPGLAEIRRLNDELLSLPIFAKDWIVFALHSSIASDEQEKAFLVPPPGVRKIVIATNIAETGKRSA